MVLVSLVLIAEDRVAALVVVVVAPGVLIVVVVAVAVQHQGQVQVGGGHHALVGGVEGITFKSDS